MYMSPMEFIKDTRDDKLVDEKAVASPVIGNHAFLENDQGEGEVNEGFDSRDP